MVSVLRTLISLGFGALVFHALVLRLRMPPHLAQQQRTFLYNFSVWLRGARANGKFTRAHANMLCFAACAEALSYAALPLRAGSLLDHVSAAFADPWLFGIATALSCAALSTLAYAIFKAGGG